jgi:hypothetical protein
MISKLIFISPALTILLVITSLPPLFFYLNLALSSIFTKTKKILVTQNFKSRIPAIAASVNVLLTPTIGLRMA